MCVVCVFFQAEDGIRDLVRSRGLGDVYKRQRMLSFFIFCLLILYGLGIKQAVYFCSEYSISSYFCLLYTSAAADERSSVDLGGRRIIKKKSSRA